MCIKPHTRAMHSIVIGAEWATAPSRFQKQKGGIGLNTQACRWKPNPKDSDRGSARHCNSV